MNALLIALAAGPIAAAPPAADRPNVILILADDFGYECVRSNGGTSYRTPHLDALAAGGMRFTQAYSTPLCTPSRVQLMTGRYNFRNYVRFGEFDFRERTFAHALKGAGYATMIAGKWQLSGGEDGPKRAGFDESVLWQLYAEGKGSRYADPVLHKDGKPLEGTAGRYGPDVFLEHIRGFVSRHREGPFLVYWPMVLTHAPFDPTPDSPGSARRDRPENFPDMVAYLDKNVGELVAHLGREGLRERTLILFVGDNGTGRPITSTLDGRPYRGGKGTTTTAGTHVPLIASWPGRVPAGVVDDDLVDFSDVLPTLAQAAGAELPAGIPLDGRSFFDQLLGKPGVPREWIFCHYEPRHGNPTVRTRYAQDRGWKLYQDGRLFDLRADPAEERPIAPDAGDEGARTARAKLKAVLDRMDRERPFDAPG